MCEELENPEMQEDTEDEICAISRGSLNEINVVSWQQVKEETRKDESLQKLGDQIVKGFPERRSDLGPTVQEYWEARKNLSIIDGVIVKGQQIVIPTKLRQEVLKILGCAHQGVGAMKSNAKDCVYWPGYTNDIMRAKNQCRTCWECAPSQPKGPSVEPMLPTMPFESIVVGYCDLEGKHYLVTGDRLSAWTEVQKIAVGSNLSGAKGLISALRQNFTTYGVPEELSSDGGPEFSAKETQDFLKRWNVRHRMLSAYMASSNGRAELAVKSTKRLLRDNVGPGGTLNTDKFVRTQRIQTPSYRRQRS